MTRSKTLIHFTIKEKTDTNSYKIFIQGSSFSTQTSKAYKTLLEFLTRNNKFVKDHKKTTSQFNLTSDYIETDAAGVKFLLDEGAQIGAVSSSHVQFKAPNDHESELNDKLEKIREKLGIRIWLKQKNDDRHKSEYCCKVEGKIYSCDNLEKLLSFLSGDYLIQRNKRIISYSYDPAKSFGIFEVLQDIISSSKSAIHWTKTNQFPYRTYKKKFEPIIENQSHLPIVIDGADDTANALNSSGLPQQALYLAQALAIFPFFLRGVHLGYEGLGEEAQEIHDQFNQSRSRKFELANKIENYRKELCKLCDINYSETNDDTPEEFINKISVKFSTKDLTAQNQIIALYQQYLQEVEEEFAAPKLVDVMAAYCGWVAMISMMSSVAAYEFQALANIGGGIANITKTINNDKLPLISQIGSNLGLAGQCLMVLYASHKTVNEFKDWQEVEAELQEFSEAKNVSDLAKNMATKLLAAKRNNHAIQTFGNATLAAGQTMMAASGPLIFASAPLLFGGLAATLIGVATNSGSELLYRAYQNYERDIDDLENKIIRSAPEFEEHDFQNIEKALSRHAEEQILKIEILGHLRAVKFVLYQKYNDSHSGIFAELANLAGARLANIFANLPIDSVNLIKDNPEITAHPQNEDDLSIFDTSIEDVEAAYQKYKSLEEHSPEATHEERIKIIQENFISLKKANCGPAKTINQLCERIIDSGGPGSLYLQKKLLSLIANNKGSKAGHDNSNIEDDSAEIRENGEKIIVAKLDLTQFNPDELKQFLSKKRKAKNFTFTSKEAIIAHTNKKDLVVAQTDHLGSFGLIADLSNAAKDFIDSSNVFSKTSEVLNDPIPPSCVANNFEEEQEENAYSPIPPLSFRNISQRSHESDDESEEEKSSESGFAAFSKVLPKNDASEKEPLLSQHRINTQKTERITPTSKTTSKNIPCISAGRDVASGYTEGKNNYQKLPSHTSQSCNLPKDSEQASEEKHSFESLIKNFAKISEVKISKDPTERTQQISKQKEVITKITKKTVPFILLSKTHDKKNKKTVYLYADPYSKKSDPDFLDKQITYILDNNTGKIEVVYGIKAKALFIEQPTQTKNAAITQLDSGIIKKFGDKTQSIFSNFTKQEPSKNPNNREFCQLSRSNIKSRNYANL